MHRILALVIAASLPSGVWADPPVASYIFPAGGQRGAKVPVKVGGLNLHSKCGWELLGPGATITPKLERTKTLWFEGPILPLPDSQRTEDYPQDMAGRIDLAADAVLGPRFVRLWTSQGATALLKFMVGDLPEVVEDEIDGDPIPVAVKLPVTINGRIFPRADVDDWSFTGKKGEPVTLDVCAARLGSPLEARLEIRDSAGRRLAESDLPTSADVSLRFIPPADGKYHAFISDLSHGGSQSHVYRLTITADPYVDNVFPMGGRRGDSVKVSVAGQGFDGPVTLRLPDKGDHAWLRLESKGKPSNPILFDLDELKEIVAEAKAEGAPVELNSVANGRISKPGHVDSWTLPLKKGDAFEAELRAARLGSRLDGVLTIHDVAGKELARAEATQPDGDPVLRFSAPTDGSYQVRVQDRFRSRGGPAFAYRLRLTSGAAVPDFRLVVKNEAVTLPRGGQFKLPIAIERRGGFLDAIALTIDGLPKGVTIANPLIPAKQTAFDLILKADAEATVAACRLILRGAAKLDGKETTRTAQLAAPLGAPALDSVLLATALPTPFKIKGDYEMRWAARGSVVARKYQIERLGYDGPITVSLADRQARHLQGVTGPTIVVPAGATEFTYPVHLPPWMETGRTSRTCVMGIALLKDKDGTANEVSFSSTNQNEQIVAVVEPGRLGLSLDRVSVLAAPKGEVEVGVRLARGVKLSGPAKVEVIIPGHWRGVAAPAVNVPADKDAAVIRINFGADLSPAVNAPVIVRATILEDGRPVTAETRLEFVRAGK